MTSTEQMRAAKARWTARRRRLIGYGQWQPFADAEPVRQHLRALLTAGMPLWRISELTGVHISALGAALYGSAGHAPSAKMRTESANAVLRFRPTLDDYPPLSAIDATGSLRRLQALATLGWTALAIAPVAGCPVARLRRLTYTRTVSVATARMIRDAYNTLWGRQPTDAEVPLAIAKRTRRRAQDLSWASPLAWDEGTIDDPKSKPSRGRRTRITLDEAVVVRAVRGERVDLTPAARSAAVEMAVRQGLDYETVASVLRIDNVETVKRTWERRKAAARARGEAWVKQAQWTKAA